jgi:predicted nucleic acid-binding protein
MILVDTSAFYAVLDRDDEQHQAAKAAWESLLSTEELLLVTNYVVVETVALVQHCLGMAALRTLCTDVLPAMEMHWVSEDDHTHAINALLAAARRRLSFVDCCSFHVMRSRGVRTAFAIDPHFREQGFEVVPPLEDPARGAHTRPAGARVHGAAGRTSGTE